ncbi:serine hydrolase [Parasphingorhabdus sp.]|uniref:serine hydrolase domain-containing protein n=1 Tax=Parasphingorhabdus sp. TaxID=2709688 RepID=UPI00326564D4
MMKLKPAALIFALIASMILSPLAFAQSEEKPDHYVRALAAGYKAQFICSGLWNGWKNISDIEADELTGIYDRIAAIVPTLKVDIDETERQVHVAYRENHSPRTAIWNRQTGCTAMPINFGGLKTGAPVKLREFSDDLAWPMGDRDAMGVPGSSPPQLSQIVEAASNNTRYGGKTSAVLVISDDKILIEAYKSGHDLHTAQRTWSVAKSIAGTLIGHSVQEGFSDVNAPAKILQWMKFGDPRKHITLDNLMRMSSGLTSDTAGNRTDPIYMGGASVTERATSWPLLHKPGSRFRYANNDTLLAVHAARSGRFEPYSLFQKLGMTRTYAETDWQDNYILSSQVWTTARDLGRLGMLYLNNGMWPYGAEGDERLLPENWLAYVSDPAGPQPDREFGYGATFWLMNNTPGVPKDTIGAFGNRGQYLIIIPSMDVVIVRRGYDSRATRFDIAAFTIDVVKALGS